MAARERCGWVNVRELAMFLCGRVSVGGVWLPEQGVGGLM